MRDGTFLQSPTWEDFQRQVGQTTHRIGDVLVIEHATPLGSYWYIGRAALNDAQVASMTEAAKQAGMLFVRIDPLTELRTTSYEIRATPSTQPQTTLVLDLTPSTDQLLASLHEKTRYNIRLAERKGVIIQESSDPASAAMDDFLALMAKTGSRQGIRAHSDRYYRTMLEVLNDRHSDRSGGIFAGSPRRSLDAARDDNEREISASIITAYQGDQPLAANLMLWAGDTAYYLHGASDHSQRQLMAPHLLQWSCIQRAKQRGATAYDFWGIAPTASSSQLLASRGPISDDGVTPESSKLKAESYEADASHPWSGITRFKLGFGGAVTAYPQSVDLVLDPVRYRLYQVGRTLRRALGRMV